MAACKSKPEKVHEDRIQEASDKEQPTNPIAVQDGTQKDSETACSSAAQACHLRKSANIQVQWMYTLNQRLQLHVRTPRPALSAQA